MRSPANNKRIKVYYIAAWIMLGLLVLWAAFFSYANGEKKPTFSYEKGDVYEIDKTVIDSIPISGDHQEINFQVFIGDHYKINYFRLETEGIGENEALLSMIGSSTANGYTEAFSISGVALHDGINDIAIPNQEFSYLMLAIDGVDHSIIKSAEFRESVEPLKTKGSMKAVMLAALGYLILSLITGTVYSKFIIQSNKKH